MDNKYFITIKEDKRENKLIVDDSNNNIYTYKLIIKNATINDNGIYICFANTYLNGYTYKRLYLNVNSNNSNYDLNSKNINDESKINYGKDVINKLNNYLIILIPFMIICTFSIVSIIYLRCAIINKRFLKDYQYDDDTSSSSSFRKKLLKLLNNKLINKIVSKSNDHLAVTQSDSLLSSLATTTNTAATITTTTMSTLDTPPSLVFTYNAKGLNPSNYIKRQFNEYIYSKEQQFQSNEHECLNNSKQLSLNSEIAKEYLLPNNKRMKEFIVPSLANELSSSSIVYYKILDCSLLNDKNITISEKNEVINNDNSAISNSNYDKNEQIDNEAKKPKKLIFNYLNKKSRLNKLNSFKNHENNEKTDISDTKTIASTATSNSRFYYQLNSISDNEKI